MGFYIEHFKDGTRWRSDRNKADQLIANGAVEIPKPDKLVSNLVCVVENGGFDAAAYVYNDDEFEEFTKNLGGRRARWLIYEGSPDIVRIDALLDKYGERDLNTR